MLGYGTEKCDRKIKGGGIMKYADLQKQLDEQKYFESIKQGRDMSGKMKYCMACSVCDKIRCECCIKHEDRVKINQCARAYSRGAR